MCRTISKAHLFLKALQGHKEVRLQLYAQLFGMWSLGFAIDGSFGYKHAKTQDTCSDRYSHCSLHTVLHTQTHIRTHTHTHTHTPKHQPTQHAQRRTHTHAHTHTHTHARTHTHTRAHMYTHSCKMYISISSIRASC